MRWTGSFANAFSAAGSASSGTRPLVGPSPAPSGDRPERTERRRKRVERHKRRGLDDTVLATLRHHAAGDKAREVRLDTDRINARLALPTQFAIGSGSIAEHRLRRG